MRSAEGPSALLVIGASAGGVEAIGRVLADLPADLPAVVVVAQHVAPTRANRLAEVLARHTRLRVHTIADREPLQPGTVYVIPPGWDAEVRGAEITLCTPTPSPPHATPSIDRLLTTAAAAFQAGVIAVILSGTGSDGTAGARVVRERGGRVVAQNPRTARFSGMPGSVAPATVNVTEDLPHIGALLSRWLAARAVPALLPPPQGPRAGIEGLLDAVRNRSGIDFHRYKRPTIQRRLQRRMDATGSGSLQAYRTLLERHPEEYQRLVANLLIKVTQFFRDGDLVEHLRTTILPAVLEQARSHDQEIRMWSAGCATGEEAYSLAILLSEAVQGDPEPFKVRIFATDVDEAAVAFARRGVYPASALATLPPDLLARHFRPEQDGYTVDKRLRAMIIFGQHDLAQRPPFPNLDLVLCRNVLIYFTPELQERALHLFAFSLRDGGYLVLGKAESANLLPNLLHLEDPALKVYRRHGERVLIPPTRITELRPLPRRRARAPGPPAPDRPLLRAAKTGSGTPERVADLFQQAPVGLAVVDATYDLLYLNGAARDVLQIRGPALGEDLIHLVRGAAAGALRALVDQAFADRARGPETLVECEDPADGRYRQVQVVAYPCLQTGQEPPEFVALALTDLTPLLQRQRRLEDELAQARAEAASAASRADRLAHGQRELEDANRQLTAENARLTLANEEFLLGSEELQAASEEVETLNEELQASNEELETLNEELEATVEELNTANEDLQARSAEAQDLAAASQAERLDAERGRDRLHAVLASMASALVVLDPEGHAVLTNAEYDRTFGTLPAGIRVEDPAGQSLPADAWPWRRATREAPFRTEFVLLDPENRPRWFEAVATPLRVDLLPGQEGSSGGTVLAIRDITDRSLRQLQDDFLLNVSHELRTPLTSLTLYADLIARQAGEAGAPPRLLELAGALVSQARRLRGLVEELVDASRIERRQLTLQRAEVDLTALLHGLVDAARVLPGGEALRLRVPDAPVRLQGDAGRLQQAFMNLVDNALKYSGGEQPIDLRLRAIGGEAEVEVQDYGRGIPAPELPQVFMRFHRASGAREQSPEGLGLGLYITREIVVAHGGRIEVQSVEGEGTLFRVRLPLSPERRGG